MRERVVGRESRPLSPISGPPQDAGRVASKKLKKTKEIGHKKNKKDKKGGGMIAIWYAALEKRRAALLFVLFVFLAAVLRLPFS
ncbi:MAG: hypothetical protein QM811_06690 [Pirellulales bacterium]